MGNLFHLRRFCLSVGGFQASNDAVLFESLRRPFFGGGRRIAEQRTKDINVMRGFVGKRSRTNEYLIAPKLTSKREVEEMAHKSSFLAIVVVALTTERRPFRLAA